MNERIQALYKQAHIERRQEYFSSVVDPTIKSVSVTRHFDPNLFAELIVKECAKIADDGCGSACFGLGINGAMLKEHFGVEE
jgi:hypothetical protein